MVFVVFVFKQKTAYEMRISDWSSDVCSSDLAADDRLSGRSPGRAGSGGGDQEGEVTEQPQIPFALSLSKRRSSFDLEEGRSFDRLRTNGLGVQPSSFSPLSKSRATFGSRSNLSIWLASSKRSEKSRVGKEAV